jgi:hypothetical protein
MHSLKFDPRLDWRRESVRRAIPSTPPLGCAVCPEGGAYAYQYKSE